MALLVWMYLVSLVVLVGAEFNALLFPRAMLGKELTAIRVLERPLTRRDVACNVSLPSSKAAGKRWQATSTMLPWKPTYVQ